MNIGKKGEEIASAYLVKRGFKIVERNFSKKVGELDIIAIKDKEFYFVEVKTSLDKVDKENRPEERVDHYKLKRISRAIQIYTLRKNLEGKNWRFLVIPILLNPESGTARIKIIEDVVPE